MSETSSRRRRAKAGAKDPPAKPAAAEPAPKPEPPPKTAPQAESPPVASAAAAPRRGSTATAVWVIVLLAVALGVVYATTPIWSPRLASYLPAALRDPFADPHMVGLGDRVRTLEDQAHAGDSAGDAIHDLEQERTRFSGELKTLIERVASVEAALADVRKMVEATSAPAEAADAEESLRRLSERLARLEEMGAGGDDRLAARDSELAASLAGIAARVRAVEHTGRRPSEEAPKGRAMVLAVGQLRQALHTSGPFAASLEGLKAVTGDDVDLAKAIAVLAPDAARGIPSLTALRVRFEAAAGRIVRAARRDMDGGWVERTLDRLATLVTWRSTGADSEGADAAVAEAEKYLAAGELTAAMGALKGLDGPAAAAAAPWLAQARRRLAAERALASLHVLAVSLLGPGKE